MGLVDGHRDEMLSVENAQTQGTAGLVKNGVFGQQMEGEGTGNTEIKREETQRCLLDDSSLPQMKAFL